MSRYRKKLPQLADRLFLTDGGLETTLVFDNQLELPCFAAFDLLKEEAGVEILRHYFDPYIEAARRHGAGFVLESPTWRANPDWGAQLGYDAVTLADANRSAIGLMLEIRAANETPRMPMVISGNIGPRGDGYRAGKRMSADQASDYHAAQVETFAQTEADMISAFTINYIEEAVGILRAAREAGMPAVVSYTLETDGRLPSGDTLADAIRRTDEETDGYAAYFMINCAHPTHFMDGLDEGASWRTRVRGVRANASLRSHAELDESTDLDAGDPKQLGAEYRELRGLLPRLNVLGGCCGTDHRHVQAIAAACTSGEQRSISIGANLKLAYVEQGNPAGVPVIFLPGYSDSAPSYLPLMAELPQTYRLIALTQRGHGDSDKPEEGYETARYADDLAAFMNAMVIPRAIVVGHSFGTLVALRFAIDRPGKVLGLGLLGGFGTLVGNPGVEELWTAVSGLPGVIDPQFVREFQESTLARPIPAEHLESAIAESRKMPYRVWKSLLRSLLQDDFSREIARIAAPTLAIWGEQDGFARRSDQDLFLSAIRNAELVSFPEAGHAMHWEDPAGTADVLAKCWASWTAKAA